VLVQTVRIQSESRGCVCVCRNWLKLMTARHSSALGNLRSANRISKTAEADFKRACDVGSEIGRSVEALGAFYAAQNDLKMPR